ncbi:Neurotransmitter-gated ion-channel ligand binding domain protein [Trichuris suis]|nr:Neurotransmitter-gated ion-channel ligand binding domain protein [Trichuris suis]
MFVEFGNLSVTHNVSTLLEYQEQLNRLERTILLRNTPNNRPVKDEKLSVIVLFYAVLEHIEDVNEEQQSMTVHGFQYLLWNDEYLYWNPGDYSGVSRMSVHSWRIWKPDLVLYNAADQLDLSTRMNFQQHAWVESTGRVEYFPMFRHHVTCNFDFSDYPYDVQECPIVLGSWSHSLKELDIRSLLTKPILNLLWDQDKVVVSGWEVLDVHLNITYWNVLTNTQMSTVPSVDLHYFCYPLVNIWIRLKRYSPLFFIGVLMPTVVTSLVTLCSFWAESTHQAVFLLSFNLLLQAVLAEDLLLQLPPTTSSVPRIVKYYAFNLIATAVATVIVVLTAKNVSCQEKSEGYKLFFLWLRNRRMRTGRSDPVRFNNGQAGVNDSNVEGTSTNIELSVPATDNSQTSLNARKSLRHIPFAQIIKQLSFVILTFMYFIFMLMYLH